MKNIMTVDQLIYAAHSVDNHEPLWLWDAMVQGLDDKEEKRKYKINKDIDSEERVKCAPRKHGTLLEMIFRGNVVWQ